MKIPNIAIDQFFQQYFPRGHGHDDCVTDTAESIDTSGDQSISRKEALDFIRNVHAGGQYTPSEASRVDRCDAASIEVSQALREYFHVRETEIYK